MAFGALDTTAGSVLTCCACFCWRLSTTSGITASMSVSPSVRRCRFPSSSTLISASVYLRPFWSIVRRAAEGTTAPLILLCEMCDSMPNV